MQEKIILFANFYGTKILGEKTKKISQQKIAIFAKFAHFLFRENLAFLPETDVSELFCETIFLFGWES